MLGAVTRRTLLAVVAILVGVLAAEELSMIRQQSLTWDEGADFFAGYEIWKQHDYGLNAAHPPLVKMLATIPLLNLALRVPDPAMFKPQPNMQGDIFGRELVFRNGPAYGAETLIFRARLVAGLFVVVLALLTFLAGRELFGAGAGLLAMTLFVFDPNVLAHGMYVTTDTALACLIFATVYAFYRYVKQPSLTRLALTGLAAGLALATKHSALILLPVLLVLTLGELVFRWREGGTNPGRERTLVQLLGSLAAVGVVALVVLWGCYGFRYSARPNGLNLEPSLAHQIGALPSMQARAVRAVAKAHALPESWLSGLLDVRRLDRNVPSYLLGKFYAHGVWFYFPVVLAIKSTIGLVGLLLLTAWALVTRRLRYNREVFFLTVPLALFLLATMASNLNLGVRHILPLWPFACVLAAAGAFALMQRDRRWIVAVATLVILHVVSSVRAYPNYLAYSNEAWGGPAQTYHYVADSNADWGQQLKATRAYLDGRGIRDCWIAYFVAPIVLPADYGVACRRLPTAASIDSDEELSVPPVIHGPVLISVGELYGLDYGATALNPYVGFRARNPVALIQDGILVFEGEFALPQASSLSHVQRSATLLNGGRIDEALAQAQTAEALVPGDLRAEIALADALVAAGRTEEARAHYERARAAAESFDGAGRARWLALVQKKISGN
jgi:4-amino-4-deoxy-L-arabinose transferase-like glycosyltransferase